MEPIIKMNAYYEKTLWGVTNKLYMHSTYATAQMLYNEGLCITHRPTVYRNSFLSSEWHMQDQCILLGNLLQNAAIII